MSQVQTQRLQRTIGVLQIVIIVLVVITALVHLQRGLGMSFGPPPGGGAARPQGGAPSGFNIMQLLPLPMSTLFLLNGIGYLVLGGALYLPALAQFRPIVRWLLILFTAVTFVMYFLIVGFRANPVGLLDKAVELVLMILLFVDGRQSTRSPTIATREAVPS